MCDFGHIPENTPNKRIWTDRACVIMKTRGLSCWATSRPNSLSHTFIKKLNKEIWSKIRQPES